MHCIPQAVGLITIWVEMSGPKSRVGASTINPPLQNRRPLRSGIFTHQALLSKIEPKVQWTWSCLLGCQTGAVPSPIVSSTGGSQVSGRRRVGGFGSLGDNFLDPCRSRFWVVLCEFSAAGQAAEEDKLTPTPQQPISQQPIQSPSQPTLPSYTLPPSSHPRAEVHLHLPLPRNIESAAPSCQRPEITLDSRLSQLFLPLPSLFLCTKNISSFLL